MCSNHRFVLAVVLAINGFASISEVGATANSAPMSGTYYSASGSSTHINQTDPAGASTHNVASSSCIAAGSDEVFFEAEVMQTKLETQSEDILQGKRINPSENVIRMLANKYGVSEKEISSAIQALVKSEEKIKLAALDKIFLKPTAGGTSAPTSTNTITVAPSSDGSAESKSQDFLKK